MIYDILKNCSQYSCLAKGLSDGLAFLASTDFEKFLPGRVELDGENMYALFQEYLTRPAQQGQWEAHRRYIDIQYILRGNERILFANTSQLTPGKYDAEKDSQSFTGKGSSLDLLPGDFVIFFPQDAHMPGIAPGMPRPVKKVVVKIKI